MLKYLQFNKQFVLKLIYEWSLVLILIKQNIWLPFQYISEISARISEKKNYSQLSDIVITKLTKYVIQSI